ncbi:hypothetical protein [Buttiauxella agrestis]|uniref:hypothetical protein n=1 Tax=Buttiauxella agrestis TaxID=82977 RepID=UPI003974A538
MIKHIGVNVFVLSMFIAEISYADVVIKSPIGGVLTFSQEKKGEHYDSNSWGNITFSRYNHPSDLSRSDRYYVEDGSSKLSPSGKYLIITSISGEYIEFGGGTSKYTDRAYCSVADMTNGCIVSDWDGEACGYTWVGNQDILANSEDAGSNKFDFESMRPAINKIIDNFSTLGSREVANMLRCDSPSKENINKYQALARNNIKSKKIVLESISTYLNGIQKESSIKVKSYLFITPDNNSQTKAFLVPGDKVKIIQSSSDNRWVNIGYINSKGSPLISWIQFDAIK